jgi:hypothetical protein
MQFGEWFEWWRAESDADYKSLYSLAQEKLHQKFLDLFARDVFRSGWNAAVQQLKQVHPDMANELNAMVEK